MAATLTRTDQVVVVLNTGGWIAPSDDGRLLRLFDQAGTSLPAWQTAIKAAAKKAKPVSFNAYEALGWIRTAKEDLLRGDLLDALDSLEMALARVRAAREIQFPALASASKG